jgi:signal transduction histidine kinase
VGLVDALGKPDVIVARDQAKLPILDGNTLAAVVGEGKPGFSDLVAGGEPGTFLTFAAVPVVANGQVTGAIYVGMTSKSWLAFLDKYPVAPAATLTVNDRAGFIIARTLNPETSVGRRSVATFWDQTTGREEGAFEGTGLDGVRYYSAFSRSPVTGYLMGTGVPASHITTQVWTPVWVLIAGLTSTMVLAVVLATILAGKITGALERLKAVAVVPDAEPHEPLDVAEAESVRLAMVATQAALRERESQLIAAREEAMKANAAKDAFLAILSHELRNPLAAITTAHEVLRHPKGRPHLEEMLRRIARQTAILKEFVDELLDLSRLVRKKVTLSKATVDLADVVHHAVEESWSGEQTPPHRLTLDLESALVEADPLRLRQIVVNLVENALKFTPPDGFVRIFVWSDHGHAYLVVEDTGEGIGPQLLPSIFDAFVQAPTGLDRPRSGLGLGLAIVHDLVRLHEGTITAESEGVGKGSRFTVQLPLAAAARKSA